MRFCPQCRVALQEQEDGSFVCFRCNRQYDYSGLVLNENQASELHDKLEKDRLLLEKLRQDFPQAEQQNLSSPTSDKKTGGIFQKFFGKNRQ